MTLIGNNSSYNLNWTGWTMLQEVLHGLGQDTSCMDGLNDGRPISRTVYRGWAEALKTALLQQRLYCVCIPAKGYENGVRKTIRIRAGSTTPGQLDDDLKVWLEEVVQFFETSKGALRQY